MVGTVTDTTGAVIPGATVTLANVQTGSTTIQTTDNHGVYHFFGVQPGEGYKVTVSHEGFAAFEATGLTLNVSLTRTLDVKLKPASVTVTATVSANSSEVTLNTTDATIGNNINVEQLQDLPIYDRTAGISTLFYLQPGVAGTNGNDTMQPSVTGARTDQSSVTVDGLDVNDIAAGTAFAIVGNAPVDSIEQFTGAVGGLVSEVGTGSGGQFQLVTKHGTNKFHGNVNEYHRDTTTEANPWFNNLHGLPRTPLIRNQFGGNIGGPILRNKLFFFFDYAGSRIVQSSTSEPTVPLDYLRNGELNYINSGPGCTGSARLTTAAQCITTLSPAQVAALDPAGQGFDSNVLSFITSRYPKATDPSGGDGVNTGGAPFTWSNPSNDDTYITRVDYQLSQTQKVYGRFTINRANALESGPEFAGDPVTHPRYDKSYSYVISHVWTIGSNKVNQAYFGDNIQRVQFPDLYNPTGANQYSFTGLSGPYTSYDGQARRVPIPLVRDDFNWQKGSHSITFGGLFKWIKTSSLLVNDFNFVDGGLSGSNLSNGLDASVRPADINQAYTALNDYDQLFATGLGVIGQISTNFNYNNKLSALPAGSGSNRNYRYYQFEGYAGDTWKVSRRLTLSYGVRYQLYSAPYEVNGNESIPTSISLNNYIAARQKQISAGDTSNTGLPLYSWVLGGPVNHGPDYFSTPKKDIAPRVAFTFSPFDSGKTVINGGAGIVYDRTVINTINFLQDQISFLFSNSNESVFGSGAGAAASLAVAPRMGANLAYDSSLNPAAQPVTVPYTPFVDSSGNLFGMPFYQSGFVINQNLKDPYSIALNFGVQQELPDHFILKVNYAGRMGRRLLADADSAQILDVPDYVGHSNQTMVQAFADLTKQLRAGKNYTNVTPEPWFENVMVNQGSGLSNTATVAGYAYNNVYDGDMSDAIVTMAYLASPYGGGMTGLWPNNMGIPGQFASNAYLTNMGNSNYNAMLVTLNRNLANGLRFDINYTWAHSIDNNSQAANSNALYEGTGIICDITQPRACRGNSDFDIRHQINGDFTYELPFGRGRSVAANTPRWADEIIGGWDISGLPAYRTGYPVSPLTDAYLASDFNRVAANWVGTNKSDLKAKINVDRNSGTVYMFQGGAAGATKVLNQFQGPVGLQYGNRNMLRGPGGFFFDAGLQKVFPIVEELRLTFRADAFNVLNHPVFSPGAVNITDNASNFGQITGTINGSSGWSARVAQFSLRLEF